MWIKRRRNKIPRTEIKGRRNRTVSFNNFGGRVKRFIGKEEVRSKFRGRDNYFLEADMVKQDFLDWIKFFKKGGYTV